MTEVFSIAKIKELQAKGALLNEKLFTKNISGNAYELFNALLVSAKNNFGGKKFEILGPFYGRCVFETGLEPFLMHLLFLILNSLNFKELYILSIVGQHEKYCTSLESNEVVSERGKWFEVRIIQNSLSKLIQKGLLRQQMARHL